MTIFSSLILVTGMWRAVLLTPGGELPFQLKVTESKNSYTLTVINGEEQIVLDEVTMKGDSMLVRFPVYESELRLKIINKNKLEGEFINLTRTTHAAIRFVAQSGDAARFPLKSKKPSENISGRWAVLFSPGSKDSSFAVGVFTQTNTHVTGTFLTSSGDYRYLEGAIDDDSLYLSTFDGVFVYLFKAKVSGDKLTGIFYSGTHRQVNFTGIRNDSAQLP